MLILARVRGYRGSTTSDQPCPTSSPCWKRHSARSTTALVERNRRAGEDFDGDLEVVVEDEARRRRTSFAPAAGHGVARLAHPIDEAVDATAGQAVDMHRERRAVARDRPRADGSRNVGAPLPAMFAARVELEPFSPEQYLAVHDAGREVTGDRPVLGVRVHRPVDLPLEVEADRHPLADLARERVGGIVELDRERFEPVRPVLERCLAPELGPQPFGAHLETLARQRDLVVADDDRAR